MDLLKPMRTYFSVCSVAACQYVFPQRKDPPACSCCWRRLASLSLAVPTPKIALAIWSLTLLLLLDIAAMPLNWLTKLRLPLYSKQATQRSRTFRRRLSL